MKKILIALIVLAGLTSCNSFHKKESVEYVKNLAKGNYGQTIAVTDTSFNDMTNQDSILKFTQNIGDYINFLFGKEPEITFLSSEKKLTISNNNSAANNEVVQLEIANETTYAIIIMNYNPSTGKVKGIQIGQTQQIIPMTKYWVSLAIGLLVIAFIIYTIVKIKRSDTKKKWLKYILTILINCPTMVISAQTMTLQLFKIQLFGFGFTFFGHQYNVNVAFPLAAIVILYMLTKEKNKNRGAQKEEEVV